MRFPASESRDFLDLEEASLERGPGCPGPFGPKAHGLDLEQAVRESGAELKLVIGVRIRGRRSTPSVTLPAAIASWPRAASRSIVQRGLSTPACTYSSSPSRL